MEHVNKLMKLTMVSQCTAANNNRRDKRGRGCSETWRRRRLRIVARAHIVNGPRSASLPSNQYSLDASREDGVGFSGIRGENCQGRSQTVCELAQCLDSVHCKQDCTLRSSARCRFA